ncbi:SMI1/KNR4 family protein [Streptomyces sp. NPDC020875]|uniref:SMI1/KNR4 family protein n=1 Tax=Streptomyces sp. NPDC020875 TaxID=3154898 RepID=UPI00340A1D4D
MDIEDEDIDTHLGTDRKELRRTVAGIVWPDTRELVCDRPGHPAGHECLLIPGGGDPELTLEAMRAVLGIYGSPLLPGPGMPSLPGAEEVDWRYAWAHAGSWVGVGVGRDDPDVGTGRGAYEAGQVVVIVADRCTPDPDRLGLPEDASWTERLVAVTRWTSPPAPSADWESVESRLGTRLPADYKEMINTFGTGSFDGFHDVRSPEEVIWYAEYAARRGQEKWEPYPPHPASPGLLSWAGDEHHNSFYWITEGPDPDRWPVLALDEGMDGERFDMTLTEFVFRILTDPHAPFTLARDIAHPWFSPYRRP